MITTLQIKQPIQDNQKHSFQFLQNQKFHFYMCQQIQTGFQHYTMFQLILHPN